MADSYLIKNVTIVNEYARFPGSVFIEHGIIKKVLPKGSPLAVYEFNAKVINGEGKLLLPGLIDDQVHFREPGQTHKADIESESKAAIAGGITSYLEMPNNKPPAITNAALEAKYQRAEGRSWANYSFYLGATNDNIDEIKMMDPERHCGVKVFMGSSTGNMLVDDEQALHKIFEYAPTIIAAHCEDEQTIQTNMAKAREEYGDKIPFSMHPQIRSAEACYKSSSKAKHLAELHNSKLHILHLTTADEMELFEKGEDPKQKQLTAEVCVHHLWFNENDYKTLGSHVKWNPAIKSEQDRIALLQALLDDRIDIVATDHAPHTLEEKQGNYEQAPSGGPLVQHALLIMLELVHQGLLSVEKVVRKMAHNPALLFDIYHRGFIKEGYWADLILVDMDKPTEVTQESLLYKCGWSPLLGYTFKSSVTHTFVNGKLVVEDGKVVNEAAGMRLAFDR